MGIIWEIGGISIDYLFRNDSIPEREVPALIVPRSFASSSNAWRSASVWILTITSLVWGFTVSGITVAESEPFLIAPISS